MTFLSRPDSDSRSRGRLPLILVAVCSALVLAVTTWGARSPSATSPSHTDGASLASVAPRAAGRSFDVLQMNLCLSGWANCHPEAKYPAVLREAVARIRATRPDAITLNEGCRRDAGRIARRTGYDVSFTRVIYAERRLRCIRPHGRGLFGNAVLTKSLVVTVRTRAFRAQAGPEERRWLCVRTRAGREVCTAHLEVKAIRGGRRANRRQCAELGRLLTRRSADRAVVFGGDVNRQSSCAPSGFWTRTDGAAQQAAGLQHVYGTAADLRRPATTVLATRNTDHDLLLVRAQPE